VNRSKAAGQLVSGAVLLLSAVALSACGDALSPEEMAGTFELTQVDGESPAHVVAVEQDTAGTDTTRTLEVVDGSISISSDSSVSLSVTGALTTESGGSTDSNTNNAVVSGSLEGGDLVFSADSIDLNSYPFAIAGTDASSSVITVDLSRSESPFAVSINLRFAR